MSEESPKLLTAAQVAEALQVKQYTVLQWLRVGKIRAAVRGYKVVRFVLADVLADLNKAEKENQDGSSTENGGERKSDEGRKSEGAKPIPQHGKGGAVRSVPSAQRTK